MSKVVLVTVSSPRFPFGVDWLSTGRILPPRRPNVNYFFEKFEKMYDYILIDNMENEKVQIEYFLNKDYIKNILVINSEKLGVSELQKLAKKLNKYEQNQQKSLHIIENKYKLSSISPVVIKEIFNKKIEILKIYKSRYHEKILEKIWKNRNIKINKLLELKIQQLLR